MIDSYVLYADKLKGEYAETFKEIEFYCNTAGIDDDSKEERLSAIAKVYANEPKIVVKAYSDLTVDFAKRENASYIIKGIRSIKDFEYEREQAEINRMIGGVETLLLYADPKLASISSSMVRELENFGRNIDEFLP